MGKNHLHHRIPLVPGASLLFSTCDLKFLFANQQKHAKMPLLRT